MNTVFQRKKFKKVKSQPKVDQGQGQSKFTG